jgi:ribonuclease J
LIVHSGDFKFDHTPVDGWPTDYAKLAEFSGRGVLALLSDSTNSDRPGATLSEAVLNDAFHQVMREAPGRVIVATFASLISRIQQVVDVAAQHDRKIAIAGRTMADNTKMARELGYLNIPDGMLMTLGEIKNLPARETVIMATGTQGEPTAVLSRLAVGQHRSLNIREGDTVVFSSHTIPGNEELIHRVVNRLFQRGADVYYDPLSPVHVSGHASQEEQKLLINILGERLEIGERVPGDYIFVDGARVGEIGPAVMRERETLGRNGFVMCIVRYERRTGRPVGRPRIITKGFIFAPGAEDLLAQAEEVTLSAALAKPRTSPEQVEKQIQAALSKFLYQETKGRPIVIPTVIET